jgi:hypothetical protein
VSNIDSLPLAALLISVMVVRLQHARFLDQPLTVGGNRVHSRISWQILPKVPLATSVSIRRTHWKAVVGVPQLARAKTAQRFRMRGESAAEQGLA